MSNYLTWKLAKDENERYLKIFHLLLEHGAVYKNCYNSIEDPSIFTSPFTGRIIFSLLRPIERHFDIISISIIRNILRWKWFRKQTTEHFTLNSTR